MATKAVKVFLIGLPGSGKTTLASQVGAALHVPVLDLDTEIERVARKNVREIFKDGGERYFRDIETQALKSAIEMHDHFVMATGGGAPCFNDNLRLMKQTGIVVFLDVPVEEICSRIEKQAIDRPLLKDGDLLDKIGSLRKDRLPFYSQAHFSVTGTSIQSNQIVDLLR